MNAERAGRITAVGSDSISVELAARCSNCSGCGGRCSLLAGTAATAERVELPLNRFDGSPGIGLMVRVYLPEAALLRHARIGYGWPLAGLLLGALSGHATASALGSPPDGFAVLLAAAGTLLGIGISKRTMPPACRAAPVVPADGADVRRATSTQSACNEESP